MAAPSRPTLKEIRWHPEVTRGLTELLEIEQDPIRRRLYRLVAAIIAGTAIGAVAAAVNLGGPILHPTTVAVPTAAAGALLLSLAALAVRQRGLDKRGRAAARRVQDVEERLVREAVEDAQTQYGITGLDPDLVSLRAGEHRDATVTRDGQELDVTVTFLTDDSPLSIHRDGDELPTRNG